MFDTARVWLEEARAVQHWGYTGSREEYWRILHSADVVVSTAIHEFFGVAVVEAVRDECVHTPMRAAAPMLSHRVVQVRAGCWPMCPARLAYPEILAPTPDEMAQPSIAHGQLTELRAHPPAPWWQQRAASDAPLEPSHDAAASALRERFLPWSDRVDVRPSPHLYKHSRELQRSLLDMCQNPETVRAWARSAHERDEEVGHDARLHTSAEAAELVATSATTRGHAMMDEPAACIHSVLRFAPEELRKVFVSLLQP